VTTEGVHCHRAQHTRHKQGTLEQWGGVADSSKRNNPPIHISVSLSELQWR